MTTIEIYRKVYESVKGYFELNRIPSPGDFLWTIIINGRFDGRKVIFVPTLRREDNTCDGGWFIGIAEAEEQGYIPTNVKFSPKLQLDYSRMSDICDEMTEEVFGITAKEACIISLRSMRESA